MSRVLNSETKSNPSSWPSESDLANYLLGESADCERALLEKWIAEDTVHADRLCVVAEAVLLLDRSSQRFQDVQTGFPAVAQREPAVAATGHSSRSSMVFFAMAASILLALFVWQSINHSQRNRSEIAMAWVESLPESVADLPDWISESEPAESSGVVGLSLSDDTAIASIEGSGRSEVSDEVPTFGFSSNEPPDWLVAAVISMESAADFGEGNLGDGGLNNADRPIDVDAEQIR